MGIKVRPRWHFNRKGQYTGQSMDPGIFGWLYFIGPFLCIALFPFIAPIFAWTTWESTKSIWKVAVILLAWVGLLIQSFLE